jgi:transposase
MFKSAATRLFGLSLYSVKCYVRIANRGASLESKKGGGRPPKVHRTTEKNLLEEDVYHKRPAATVSERRRLGSGIVPAAPGKHTSIIESS